MRKVENNESEIHNTDLHAAIHTQYPMTIITDLFDLIDALSVPKRKRFARLFEVDSSEGCCVVPLTMRDEVVSRFGSIETVERQTIVRVVNKWSWEGAIFNPIRAKRPMPASDDGGTTYDAASFGDDPFAEPLKSTTEDLFGRVRGKHCITTSNISRWEGQNAVLIFDEPDPLKFTRDHFRDYFAASIEWARKANAHDSLARYFVWGWNGGIKAGASIPHAHAQMALGRNTHYARVEMWRRILIDYRAKHNANYFDDLLGAHEDIGLTFPAAKLRGFVNLAAIRPKDTWIFGEAMNDDLADALYETLHALVHRTNMQAFNVIVLMPPPFGDRDGWDGFPTLVRIVDRGSPAVRSSDLGLLDVFAQNVISEDPFVVREKIAKIISR
jgi:hypothetical protein